MREDFQKKFRKYLGVQLKLVTFASAYLDANGYLKKKEE